MPYNFILLYWVNFSTCSRKCSRNKLTESILFHNDWRGFRKLAFASTIKWLICQPGYLEQSQLSFFFFLFSFLLFFFFPFVMCSVGWFPSCEFRKFFNPSIGRSLETFIFSLFLIMVVCFHESHHTFCLDVPGWQDMVLNKSFSAFRIC